jgi:hypothetical protein
MAGPQNTDFMTTVGVGTLAIIGGVAKGSQWRDPKTGEMNFALLMSGIAASLVLAAAVRAIGVHFGIEPWAQVAAAGVLCYVGPDPIIRVLANMILSKAGFAKLDGPGNENKQ